VATICVQTGLNPACHILESPCQYGRCHCLKFFGDVQGVYGSWFVCFGKQNKPQTKQTLSQMIERSAERHVRQETGWLAGGPLLHVATIRRTTDTFLFISHTTNILLFKFRCNIFIGVRIIKEMPGLVASGTLCIKQCWKSIFWKGTRQLTEFITLVYGNICITLSHSFTEIWILNSNDHKDYCLRGCDAMYPNS
jgi:hypothetical protein